MTLLLLEALLALLILIGIVWWTMFSGRIKGEIRSEEPTDQNTNIESK
jgi:cytoskeletal protein RodZ